jgi:hypothetical protein
VYCPRCGAHCKTGTKFCSSCGETLDAGLPAKAVEKRRLRDRLAKMAGENRTARLLTAGTAVAAVVVVAAFLALPSDDGADEIPYDAYTRAADRLCVAEKQAIVAAGQAALAESGGVAQLAAYAGGVVPIVVEWRSSIEDLSAPADRAEQAENLSQALRRVAVEAGATARVARTLGQKAALVRANEVDAATAEVEEAVDELGLRRCANLRIGVVRGN